MCVNYKSNMTLCSVFICYMFTLWSLMWTITICLFGQIAFALRNYKSQIKINESPLPRVGDGEICCRLDFVVSEIECGVCVCVYANVSPLSIVSIRSLEGQQHSARSCHTVGDIFRRVIFDLIHTTSHIFCPPTAHEHTHTITTNV